MLSFSISNLTQCFTCGREVAYEAAKCVHCGVKALGRNTPQGRRVRRWMKRLSLIAAALLITSTAQAAVNVDDYGCAHDGVTDDAGCIAAAVAAAPSGATVAFGAGKTYLINSNPGANYLGIYIDKPLTLAGNGATVLVGPDTAHAVFGVNVRRFYDRLALKPIVLAHRGDRSLTLVNPADVVSFTPGDVLYLRGETHDLFDRGLNIIAWVDATNGRVGLQWPLGKDYVLSPQAVDGESATVRNFTMRDFNVQWTRPGPAAQFVTFGQVYHARFEHNRIDATNLTNTEPVSGGSNIDVWWLANEVTSHAGGALEVGAFGSNWAHVINNVATNLGPNFADVLGSCEGCENIIVAQNRFTARGGPAAAAMIDFSTGADDVLDSNQITYLARTIAPGWAVIVDNNGQGVAVNATFTRNVIQSGGPAAFMLKYSRGGIVASNFHQTPIVNYGSTDIVAGN